MAASASKARVGAASGLDRQTLKLISRYDHVTLLPNRLQFLADFKRLRGRTGRNRMLVLVTLADVRHYNEVLRALGHAVAYDCVRAGLERIRHYLPADTEIYQVSVLSFAFVIDHAMSTGAPPLATAIAQAFQADLEIDSIPIRSSVGVGLLPLDVKDPAPAEMLRAALVAAQDSRRGDEGVAFYNHRTDAAHQRAFRILAELPGALADPDQLHLVFQPRVTIATGECHGAEALIRWRHPELGNIPPAEFIPLAEQTALIHPLTDWVIERAVRDAHTLDECGHPLTVSINASPRNLSDPGFDDRLMWACDSAGIAPNRIEIEFTEGMLAANPERAIRQLERLRAQGVEVAIDDFGSGFSSLAYLTQIPADVLKIDQSFIRPLRPGDDFLVTQILQLAAGLGLRVCAEGIETMNIYSHLCRLGCDEGQGYAIARPMPLADYCAWREAAKSRPM